MRAHTHTRTHTHACTHTRTHTHTYTHTHTVLQNQHGFKTSSLYTRHGKFVRDPGRWNYLTVRRVDPADPGFPPDYLTDRPAA